MTNKIPMLLCILDRPDDLQQFLREAEAFAVDEGRFAKELLRERGEVVGRIDSRFTGDSINNIAETIDPCPRTKPRMCSNLPLTWPRLSYPLSTPGHA